MSQIDRGTYVRDKNRSSLKRGCLGKSLKLGGVALALILVAILTVPSQERMEREVNNAVTLCILANIAGFQDNSDDVVRNMTAMISTLDTAAVKTDQVKVFKQMNQVRIYLLYHGTHPPLGKTRWCESGFRILGAGDSHRHTDGLYPPLGTHAQGLWKPCAGR